MFIDPHVHCRDEEQAYKETIAHALKTAERAGFTAIFDMPNTKRPVDSKARVVERLALAREAKSPVFYGMYMALTGDVDQIKEAVATYREFKEVVGFKLYAGHSVGRIGVIDIEKQRRIYQTLVHEDYRGVLAIHCEKESMMTGNWNPTKPITHALARPPEAEVASVRDQIDFAREYGFQGTLHIAHVSVPEAVKIAKSQHDVRVTCGVCPHHLLLDYRAMESLRGLLMKMNPPLRPPGMPEEMLELLRNREIDWIETDHAPHTLEERIGVPYLSGITGLQKYPKFVQWLRDKAFSEERIREITFDAISRAFELEVPRRECIPEYGLDKQFDNIYRFDPYDGFGVLE